MNMKGTASTISVVQRSSGRQVALDERGDHAHGQADDHRDGQAAQPGRDHRGEGGGDEQGEVARVEADDGRGQHPGQAGEEGAHRPDPDGDGLGLVPDRAVMAGSRPWPGP